MIVFGRLSSTIDFLFTFMKCISSLIRNTCLFGERLSRKYRYLLSSEKSCSMTSLLITGALSTKSIHRSFSFMILAVCNIMAWQFCNRMECSWPISKSELPMLSTAGMLTVNSFLASEISSSVRPSFGGKHFTFSDVAMHCNESWYVANVYSWLRLRTET